jgi:Protein of unknown function (DUF3738).
MPRAYAVQEQVQPAQEGKIEKGEITGTWQGTMRARGSQDQRVVLKIAKDEKKGFSAILFNLDRSGPPIVGTSVSFENGSLRFLNDFPGLTYQGKISADAKSIRGTMTQAMPSLSLPLVLERATPETEWATAARPTGIQPMVADARPDVEVSTVRPTQPGTKVMAIVIQGTDVVARNSSLTNLIKFAYQVQNRQIVGAPSWMETDKWDMVARPDIPGTPSIEQARNIMQKLLAERFRLKIKDERREMTAYVLTVAKNGPKMTRSADDASLPPNIAIGPWGVMHVRNTTLGDFTRFLNGYVLDRPVVDQTGLTGRWDFTLHWTPDETQFPGLPVPPPVADDANALSLYAAIQEQVGLNLNAQKTPVSVLVIDHVERSAPN